MWLILFKKNLLNFEGKIPDVSSLAAKTALSAVENKITSVSSWSFCAIDLFHKYAWVVPLKDKRRITIVNAFQKIISKFGEAESNKIWVDQVGEFYNKLLKRFLKINNIKMYSTYNEGKSVAAERFIRTLKNKIFKHMTASSKNICWCAKWYC